MKIKEIAISHHGRCNTGSLYLPEGEKKFPLIIMSHGYNGHKTDFDLSARFFAEKGIATYLYTFCGGSARDESGFPTTSMTIFTEKEDLNAVLDAAFTWEEIDTASIFIFGGSQGGMVSALTAEEREADIKGMILLFPALCIADDWNKRYAKEEDIPEEIEFWGMNLGSDYAMTLRGFQIFEHVGKFEKPVLVMHGDQDMIVPLSYSEHIKDIYKNIHLEVFYGEGHGFTPEGDEKMTEMTYDFMKKLI